MTLQETYKIYRKQADYFETVSPILLRVRGRTADEYERLYLAVWEEVYQKYPHYLYKDDRFCDEFGPARSEDVSALSYKRTAADVKQARANTAHTLAEQDERRFAASTDNTYRPILADLLKKAAQQLVHHMPVFEALNDTRFAPVLPPVHSSTPDRAVDEPETVGGALGLLDYFIDLHEKFLRAEGEVLAAPQPDNPTLDTPAPTEAVYPWAKIEALAVQIGLRKDGRFTPAGNRIAAAGAGFIDALLDAAILPNTVTRPVLYANFSQYYGQSIKADRAKPTRNYWHQKARKELGLLDLKPPKFRA